MNLIYIHLKCTRGEKKEMLFQDHAGQCKWGGCYKQGKATCFLSVWYVLCSLLCAEERGDTGENILIEHLSARYFLHII